VQVRTVRSPWRRRRRRRRRRKKCRRQCGTLHVEWFQAVGARPSDKDRQETRVSFRRWISWSDGKLTVGVQSRAKGYSTDWCEGFQASPACPSDKRRIQTKWVRSSGGIILTEENPSTQRKKLFQCHFMYHKSGYVWPRIELGPWQWEAITQQWSLKFRTHLTENTLCLLMLFRRITVQRTGKTVPVHAMEVGGEKRSSSQDSPRN
jgi:hypothetical protein